MIKAYQADNPSAHVLARAAKMTVETLSPTEYRVTPEEGKEVRLVRIHLEYGPPRGKYRPAGDYGPDEAPELIDVDIECFAEESHRACPANRCKILCSHVHSAISQLLLDTKGDHDASS